MIKSTLVKNADRAVDKLFDDGDDILKGLVKNELLFKDDPERLEQENLPIVDVFREEQEAIVGDLNDIEMVWFYNTDGKLVQKDFKEIIYELTNKPISSDTPDSEFIETNSMSTHVDRSDIGDYSESEDEHEKQSPVHSPGYHQC